MTQTQNITDLHLYGFISLRALLVLFLLIKGLRGRSASEALCQNLERWKVWIQVRNGNEGLVFMTRTFPSLLEIKKIQCFLFQENYTCVLGELKGAVYVLPAVLSRGSASVSRPGRRSSWRGNRYIISTKTACCGVITHRTSLPDHIRNNSLNYNSNYLLLGQLYALSVRVLSSRSIPSQMILVLALTVVEDSEVKSVPRVPLPADQ